jgi:uncharacterized protein YbcC (UPF0753/DUF2309 family)
MPFEKAVNQARKFLNANVFPESTVFRQAWEKGEIDENILLKLLGENQLLESPSIIYNKWSKKKRC